MCEFIQNKQYYFIGPIPLIECFKNDNNPNDTNDKAHLGKFIEYIGLPYVSDWLHDAKARFEYGIISRVYYDKVFLEDVNENQHMRMNR